MFSVHQHQTPQWAASSGHAKRNKKYGENGEIPHAQASKASLSANIVRNATTSQSRSTPMTPLTRAVAAININRPQDTGNERDAMVPTQLPALTGNSFVYRFYRHNSHLRITSVNASSDRSPTDSRPYERIHPNHRIDLASKAGKHTFAHFSPEHSTAGQTRPQNKAFPKQEVEFDHEGQGSPRDVARPDGQDKH